MYSLMKSERYVIDHPVSGPMSSYRQTAMAHYQQFDAALTACKTANNEVDHNRHYLLNDSGQEYYGDTWID